MRNRNSNFQRGSGVFKCSSCGNRTRKSGDNAGHDGNLCNDCFELAGIYNTYLDEGTTVVKQRHAIEIIHRCKNITSKGGTLDSDNKLLYGIATGIHGVLVETTPARRSEVSITVLSRMLEINGTISHHIGAMLSGTQNERNAARDRALASIDELKKLLEA